MYWFPFIILGIILIVLIIYNINLWKKNKEPEEKDSHITFVSKDHMKNIIYNSYYFQRMNKNDLFC